MCVSLCACVNKREIEWCVCVCYVRALRSVSARHSLTRARAWMIPETHTIRGITHILFSPSVTALRVPTFLSSVSAPVSLSQNGG